MNEEILYYKLYWKEFSVWCEAKGICTDRVSDWALHWDCWKTALYIKRINKFEVTQKDN